LVRLDRQHAGLGVVGIFGVRVVRFVLLVRLVNLHCDLQWFDGSSPITPAAPLGLTRNALSADAHKIAPTRIAVKHIRAPVQYGTSPSIVVR
jgi:hypothetical protein